MVKSLQDIVSIGGNLWPEALVLWALAILQS
jgi:hypothetical protein